MEIYIHIPFCVRKCGYCDFLSFPADDRSKQLYKDRLLEEIRLDPNGPAVPETVDSIFFGGGTPSVLPPSYIEEILAAVREVFPVAEDAEISIEANPGTVDMEKLSVYKASGINRISFGCQSADNNELMLLGRIHTWEDFLAGFEMARRTGFDNLNVDLISGLPGQSPADWEKTLRAAAGQFPEHISAYSLIIEEGTPFFEMYGDEEGSRLLPDEDAERSMYDRTEEILMEYGYSRYEISNYAREGRECRHNAGYWTGVPYIGFGLGASSFMESRRWHNTESFREYLGGDFAPREVSELTCTELQDEFMILGLRMTRGVSELNFRERFGIELMDVYGEPIRKYEGMGLIKRTDGTVAFTRPGLSVSNHILADLYRG